MKQSTLSLLRHSTSSCCCFVQVLLRLACHVPEAPPRPVVLVFFSCMFWAFGGAARCPIRIAPQTANVHSSWREMPRGGAKNWTDTNLAREWTFSCLPLAVEKGSEVHGLFSCCYHLWSDHMYQARTKTSDEREKMTKRSQRQLCNLSLRPMKNLHKQISKHSPRKNGIKIKFT
jgi:hypothetical protein